jgi:hypothetical protein
MFKTEKEKLKKNIADCEEKIKQAKELRTILERALKKLDAIETELKKTEPAEERKENEEV